MSTNSAFESDPIVCGIAKVKIYSPGHERPTAAICDIVEEMKFDATCPPSHRSVTLVIMELRKLPDLWLHNSSSLKQLCLLFRPFIFHYIFLMMTCNDIKIVSCN